MTNSPPDTYLSDRAGLAAFLSQESDGNQDRVSRLKRNLQRAIQEDLTPRQREMLLLRYSQNYSGSQISKELGVNPSTVSRTLTRAKRRIEQALKYSF